MHTPLSGDSWSGPVAPSVSHGTRQREVRPSRNPLFRDDAPRERANQADAIQLFLTALKPWDEVLELWYLPAAL